MSQPLYFDFIIQNIFIIWLDHDGSLRSLVMTVEWGGSPIVAYAPSWWRKSSFPRHCEEGYKPNVAPGKKINNTYTSCNSLYFSFIIISYPKLRFIIISLMQSTSFLFSVSLNFYSNDVKPNFHVILMHPGSNAS